MKRDIIKDIDLLMFKKIPENSTEKSGEKESCKSLLGDETKIK